MKTLCRTILAAWLFFSCVPGPPRLSECPHSTEKTVYPCVSEREPVSQLRFGVSGYSSHVPAGYGAITDYLQQILGLDVSLVLFDDYISLIEALEQGVLEGAFLTPVVYVKARQNNPCLTPLVMRIQDGVFHYTGYIVVRRDSGFTDLTQLAKQRIAFVSLLSASGYVFAMQRLLAEGFNPAEDFEQALFLGDHSAVVKAVIEKRADGGAIWSKSLQAEALRGQDIGALQILGITARIPNDLIVVRPGLNQEMTNRIRKAFEALNTMSEEGRQVLRHSFNLHGFVGVDDAFYDFVRVVMEEVEGAEVLLP